MSTDRFNLLFVDDEQRILDGLRRQLHTHRQHWNMRFASSGAEAIKMLEAQPADMLVTDMRMPGMTGGQLLRHALDTWPQMARVVLSGQTDQSELIQDVGCVHQYLQKPCDALVLCQSIERTIALFRQLRQPQLRLATTRIVALPPSSQTYNDLSEELSKEQADVSKVARIVERDPALSAKLLQLVNSAFFGMPRKMSSPREAILCLGLRTLQAIVCSSRIFEFVRSGVKQPAQLDALWQRSFEIGEEAARLAKAAGGTDAVQQNARLAGLLCLIGRGILLTSEPVKYKQLIEAARTSGQSLAECELSLFGASQDDVTAYAMGLWAFSDEIVSAMTYQSAPSRLPDAGPRHPVAYLQLARCACSAENSGIDDQMELDQAFAAKHGLDTFIQTNKRSAA